MKGFRLLGKLVLTGCILTGALAVPLAREGGQEPSVRQFLDDAFMSYRKSEEENRKAESLCGQALEVLRRATPLSPAQREQWLTALELRGRVRFLLQDTSGAQEDFTALLAGAPAHVLGSLTAVRIGEPSETSSQLFDDVKKRTIGSVVFTITPADADVNFLGVPVPIERRSGGRAVDAPVGQQTVRVQHRLYEPQDVPIDVPRGTAVPVNITLVRRYYEVHIFTSVPNVAVEINNQLMGTTTLGVPAKYEKRPDVVEMGAKRSTLTLELRKGELTAKLKLECHAPEEIQIRTDESSDQVYTKVLRDASVPIQIQGKGGSVWIDQVDMKQSLPYFGTLCPKPEPSLVEVRSARGRDVRRFQPKGEPIVYPAKLKPAIAILGQSSQRQLLSEDLRQVLEAALLQNNPGGLTFFAVPQDLAIKAMEAAAVKVGWLALDTTGRRFSETAAMSDATRQRLVRTLSSQLGVQGVAEIHVPAPEREPRKILLTYVAADGNGVPETIEINLEVQQSVNAAIADMNNSFEMARVWSGLIVADVEGVEGAVVLRRVFDTTNGVQLGVGDVVIGVDGASVRNASDFEQRIGGRKPREPLNVQVKKHGIVGPAVTMQLTPFLAMQALAHTDKTQPLNKRLLEFRFAVEDADAPIHLLAITRLNLAVMLIRAEDWKGAKAQLDLITSQALPDQPGVAYGTVQYYLGMCLEKLGNAAGAAAAYEAAAKSEAWLTADGPMVRSLIKR